MSDKQRLIDLQKQLSVARKALQMITNGGREDAYTIAEVALEKIEAIDPNPVSPGLMGWEKQPR